MFGSSLFAMKLLLATLVIVHLVHVEALWGGRRRRRSPPIPTRPYINPAYASWTRWDATFSVSCGQQKSVSRVRSIHSNHHEDRSWAFYCKYDYRVQSNCRWSGWINSFDQQLTYQCPNNGVLTGVHSKHSNHYEDRQFDFKCCNIKSSPIHCSWTGYINNYDKVMDYTVPYGKFLTGVTSHHSNHHEDRKWKLLICRYK